MKILTAVDPKELGANEAARTARIAEMTSLEAEQVSLRTQIVDAMRSQGEMLRLEARRCELTLQHFSLLCGPGEPSPEER